MNEEIPKIKSNNRGINKREIDALDSQIMRLSDRRTIANAKLARLEREIASRIAQRSTLQQDIEYYNNEIGLLKTTVKKARKE